SFADGNGDGVGDLPGVTARLPYLRDLGVDALWLTPFYTSPQHDHGYDVTDYFDVDQLFGTLADADQLIATAHALDLRVLVDIVPNHTSSAHQWFRDALAARPGSAARERYLFRDGVGPGGDRPPNNWQSVFGGGAWERVIEADGNPGQWYLHLFDTTQPDLNWRNPAVGDMFEEVLRFWLDRGADGFRIDVAHGLIKADGLPDDVRSTTETATAVFTESATMAYGHVEGPIDQHLDWGPMWDQPDVREIYRRWHRVLAEYDGDRVAVAEAWTRTRESMARYVRPDELSQCFNFAWAEAPWSAKSFRQVITDTFAALARVGAAPTWVLSNHDIVRHPTRYGGGPTGVARAKAATLLTLALPGSTYLYQGEELGLEQVEVAPEFRQDPVWLRTGEAGRDGCRVPLPWGGDAPPFEFGPADGAAPWIPQPADWAELTVAAQESDRLSTLNFYRAALRERCRLTGDTVTLIDLGSDVVAFTRADILVVLNCGPEPIGLPAEEIVIASASVEQQPTARMLPANSAAWLRSYALTSTAGTPAASHD
ncbi:MAG: glycoside hydrolase family 13 protein, partial [Nocardioides sp.]